MESKQKSSESLFRDLSERAKELRCLYEIENILKNTDSSLPDICNGIIKVIPEGWQYPQICQVKINLADQSFYSPNFIETEWSQSTNIIVDDKPVGTITVQYTKKMPKQDYGPFLKEEAKLIKTIADRLGQFLHYQRMRSKVERWDSAKKDLTKGKKSDWHVIIDLMRQTDKNLFVDLTYKLLNYLCWKGFNEAERLRQDSAKDQSLEEEELKMELNQPHKKKGFTLSTPVIEKIYQIASENLESKELFKLLQKWIHEDKLSFLIQVINRNLPLSTIADAVHRYCQIETEGMDFESSSRRGLKVSLIRRILSDQLPFINVAKNYVELKDINDLLHKVIYSVESHGKLGGKSAGLFLASQIIKKSKRYKDKFKEIKIPKTWHITSDMILYFMHYNNFAELVEQKYKDLNQIRFEYPHIVHTFKNSHFPPEMITGISVALDDFEHRPLIVRSSSLLEDGVGMAFSGKYKSLFISNQGTKQERLEALLDAIAEVYASTFAPDPIEYRAERNVLDFDEEMGIMIQEVVGTKIGPYFMPSFAGVAFSRNEFRWSPRIKREDALIRLVPGLGTRAVDRVSNDYPILTAPGKPNIRVNNTVEEILRYSPEYIDVINLNTNNFETIKISDLLVEYGNEYPGLNRIVSLHKDGVIRRPMGMITDFDENQMVVTFDGLINDNKFLDMIYTFLTLMEENLGTPVDIEFAADGRDFYLLQCRPQSFYEQDSVIPIPKDVPIEDILFTANRYISNGFISDISHIVYVDPFRYAELESRDAYLAVGRVISKLNKVLPKRRFILMGPGRWGSRGDIKLGVNVTYSDINNAALLVEMARMQGNYMPELSFGTHFFQDLVESRIIYLPLYPDDDHTIFNDDYFQKCKNLLPQILPDYSYLQDTVKVISVSDDIEQASLKIILNGESREAIGYLEKN